jgi:hypothetical protein
MFNAGFRAITLLDILTASLLVLFLLQQFMMVGPLAQHLRTAFGAPLLLAGNAAAVGSLFTAFRADTGPACSHIVPSFFHATPPLTI